MRGGLAALVLTCLALTGAGIASARGPLAVVDLPPQRTLFTRLDPVSLRPVGPHLRLFEWHDGFSFSPDGRQIAFGIQARTGVQVVDVSSFKTVRTIPQDVFAGNMAWLRPHLLVTLVADFIPTVVDPTGGQTLHRLPGFACEEPFESTTSAETRAAFAYLARGSLVAVDAEGRRRAARLPFDRASCEDRGVAARGRRAWVVGPSGVTEFGLPAARVTRRLRVRAPMDTLRVKVLALGGRRLVVGHEDRRYHPGGVELVDVRAGTRRVIDSRATGVEAAVGRFFVFDGGGELPRHTPHLGVRAYDSSGRLLYTRVRRKHVWDVEVHGRRAWAIGQNGVTSFAVRSGRVLSRSRHDPGFVTFLNR